MTELKPSGQCAQAICESIQSTIDGTQLYTPSPEVEHTASPAHICGINQWQPLPKRLEAACQPKAPRTGGNAAAICLQLPPLHSFPPSLPLSP
jgi:hypothetical protein